MDYELLVKEAEYFDGLIKDVYRNGTTEMEAPAANVPC